MIAQPHLQMTVQEYLAQERQAQIKSEYIEGEVVAMTGASRKHNLIVVNLVSSLHRQLRSRPCEIYSADMRVAVDQAEFYTYPDIVVTCEDPQFRDDQLDTLLNPTLIVEVLSPSASSYDRGEKFRRYRQLPSLQDYLIISQEQASIEHYQRQGKSEWTLVDIEGLASQIVLPSIQCQLLLQDIYEKVSFNS